MLQVIDSDKLMRAVSIFFVVYFLIVESCGNEVQELSVTHPSLTNTTSVDVDENYLIAKLGGWHNGLCNQLIGLSHAIAIASSTNRTLIIDSFNPQFNEDTSIYPNLVLDCESLKNISVSMGFSPVKVLCSYPVSLVEKKESFHVINGGYSKDVPSGKQVVKMLQKKLIHEKNVFLTKPYTFGLRDSWSTYVPRFLKNVVFTNFFYNAAEKLYTHMMSSFESPNQDRNVIAVHLRIEEDMIKKMLTELESGRTVLNPAYLTPELRVKTENNTKFSIELLNEYHAHAYTAEIDKVATNSSVVYLCTGLSIGSMNYDYIHHFKGRYPFTHFPEKNLSVSELGMNQDAGHRELNALVDLIFIEKFASVFIGVPHSSFYAVASARLPAGRKKVMLILFANA